MDEDERVDTFLVGNVIPVRFSCFSRTLSGSDAQHLSRRVTSPEETLIQYPGQGLPVPFEWKGGGSLFMTTKLSFYLGSKGDAYAFEY